MSTRLRAIARDTLDILDAGTYVNARGETVHLADPVRAAVAGTRLHLPDEPLDTPPVGGRPPRIEVTGESTLLAARRLAAGGKVAALVFASAKNPGGGFRTGAQAQEESIARASALFPCLASVPEFYDFHRQQRDLCYSDRVIHSPRVPVFRDDQGRLLDATHPVSFLTAAAPNLGAVRSNQPDDVDRVPPALRARARRVLAVAAAYGHRRLVLGAWGCGVFRNDPATVAEAFDLALADAAGWFDQVTFAVLDRADGPTYAAFAARLLPG
ncbi:TIGR02452 family protein [Micromonospora sp. NPDC048930]|uniref:TIGR02452 family protein n=1 Tax=Micromonospora sp. NPDC048930 TaxID=3364261 RepID=UPI00371A4F9D